MGLEVVTHISDLVTTNPVSSDARSQGDDHLRNLKVALRTDFPNADRAYYFDRVSASKTADFTIVSADMNKLFPVNCTADHVDVTLPALGASNDGWAVKLVKTDATANTVRIAGTINGDSGGFTLLRRYQTVNLLWTGTEWLAFHPIIMVDDVPTFTDLDITALLELTSTSYMLPPRGTTAQRPGADLPGAFRYNSTLESIEWQDASDAWRQPSTAAPIVGQFRNLVCTNNAVTPNTQWDIDADYVIVYSSTGVARRLSGINLTINAATTGANALDAGGLAVAKWYFGYVIYNPTTGTTAGLLSLSATAPTLPSGYTESALLTAVPTAPGAATFLRLLQKGNRSQYVVSTGFPCPLVAQGSAGTISTTSPVLAAKTIRGDGFACPSIATVAELVGYTKYANSVAGDLMAAPSTSWGYTNSGPLGSVGLLWPIYMNNSHTLATTPVSFLLEGNDIGYAGNANGSAVQCHGFHMEF